MKRRDFLHQLAAVGLMVLAPRVRYALQTPESNSADTDVKRVLVMFKCHLDVGFIDTQANIIQRYFEQFFPKAIEIAAAMRREGNDRYIWTTGSWLVYQYLERPMARRPQMEQAIAAGDLAWHALPFTWQTELMDRSLIAGGLGLSKSLDRRFGRTTTGAKMTDVPGHTRAIIGPLAEHGVKFLDIGVNSASTPPDVPPIFLWKDAAGSSLVMMYHLHSYGGVVQIPGSDLAVDVEMRDDNAGPHTLEEIRAIYARLRKQFPNAAVTAANLADIANAVEPFRGRLPVVTQEIGDTWIYGAPSDPRKLARYREVARLRREWVEAAKLEAGGPADLAFLSSFLLEVEHTWGTDTKTWLDFDHYTPRDLAAMLDRPKYRRWCCQAGSKSARISSMPSAPCPTPLRAEAQGRVRALDPTEPQSAGFAPHARRRPHRDQALHHRLRLPHRRHQPAAHQTGRPRMGLAHPPAGPVRLPDAIQGRLRPLLRRLPEEPRRLGAQGLRQAQYRTLRRREPHLAAIAHRARGPSRTPAARAILAQLRIDDAAEPRRPAEPPGRRGCTSKWICPTRTPRSRSASRGSARRPIGCPKRCGSAFNRRSESARLDSGQVRRPRCRRSTS